MVILKEKIKCIRSLKYCISIDTQYKDQIATTNNTIKKKHQSIFTF